MGVDLTTRSSGGREASFLLSFSAPRGPLVRFSESN